MFILVESYDEKPAGNYRNCYARRIHVRAHNFQDIKDIDPKL